MKTPKEIPNKDKATSLTLHLVDASCPLPEWVDSLTLEMAKQVFDANRGKFELEVAAVKKVIDERYTDGQTY